MNVMSINTNTKSEMSADQDGENQDTKELVGSIDRLFEDFDIDGDDKLVRHITRTPNQY